jgi:hypothetical protein
VPTAGEARQEEQAEAIRRGKRGPLDLAPEDDELLPEEGIFGDQFGFRPGQIAERPADRCARRRLEECQQTLPGRAQRRPGAASE